MGISVGCLAFDGFRSGLVNLGNAVFLISYDYLHNAS
jgi:hypothetical protein